MAKYEHIHQHLAYRARTLDVFRPYGGILRPANGCLYIDFVFPSSLYLTDIGALDYRITFCIQKPFFDKYLQQGEESYMEDEAILTAFFTARKVPLCFALHTNLLCLMSSHSKKLQKKFFVEGYLMFMLYQITVLYQEPCAKCNSSAMNRVFEIQHWIDENLSSGLNLHHLAYDYGLPSDSLNVLFSRYTGENIYDYVRNKRLSHANHLMQNTLHGMAEIASKSGYSSRYTMQQAYEKFFRTKPVLVLRN